VTDRRRPSLLRRWFRDESVRRVYRNAGVLFRGRIAAGLLSLAYLSIAAHTLGPRQLGVLVLLNVYVGTVGDLLLFPGWHSVIRYGTAALAEGRRRDFQSLLGFASLAELGSGLLGIAVAATLVPWIGPRLGMPAEVIPLAMGYGVVALSSARTTPAAILYLAERYNTLALQQSIGGVVRLTGAGLAAWTDLGLPGFVFAWLVAALVEAGSQWAFALRELRRQGVLSGLFAWPRGVTRIHPGLWRFSITTKLDKSLEELSPRIAPLAVGFVLEPAAVGLYHVALRLGMLLAQPAMVLVGTVYPELTGLAASHDLRSIRRVVRRTGMVAAGAAVPLLLVYVVFGRPLLEAVGGEGFDAAYGVLILIAAARVVHLLGFPLGSALQAIGRPGAALRVNAGATLLLFPVLIGLLHGLGLIGTGIYAVLFATFIVGGLGASLWMLRAEPRRTPGQGASRE
jgi:O-antigen/teichoic acid export membrane protein